MPFTARASIEARIKPNTESNAVFWGKNREPRDEDNHAAQALGLTDDHLQPVVEAIEQDFRAASADAAVAEQRLVKAEERLVKIETQTRVLAEAVVAIIDTADTLAPAVQAVE